MSNGYGSSYDAKQERIAEERKNKVEADAVEEKEGHELTEQERLQKQIEEIRRRDPFIYK